MDSSSKSNSRDSHPSSSDASPLHEARTIPSTLVTEPNYTKSTQDSNARATNGVVKRLKNNDTNNSIHRKSLINSEEVASSNQQTDDEWDAILGELSVLESQFNNELSLSGKARQSTSSNNEPTKKKKLTLGINKTQGLPEASGFDVDDGDADEETPLDDDGVFSALFTVVIVIGDTTSILVPFVPPITLFNCLFTFGYD